MRARTGWRPAIALLLTSVALAAGGTSPASAAAFPVTDLGVLAGGSTSNGTAINDLGVGAGMSDLLPSGQRTPVLFQAGTVTQLPDCCFGAAAPRAINATGEMAGTNNMGYATDAIYWDGQGHSVTLPVNPAVATNWQSAFDINSSGTIVGEAVESGNLNRRPVVWQRGAFSRDLGFFGKADPGFAQYNSARGINEAGDIVGDSLFGSTYHAWIYRAGAFTDLGVGRTVDINDSGLVVGHYQTGQPAIWRNGVRTLLPSLAGSTPAYGYYVTDVNNNGDVVGYGPGANGFDTAVLWRGGKAINLGRAGTGQRSRALGINNLGQVIGEGSIVSGGVSHALRWDTGGAGGGTTNTAPTVTLTNTTTLRIPVGGKVTFKGSFTDPDNGPWTYAFAFGNGSTNGTATAPGSVTQTRTYATAGRYPVSFTVTDASGASTKSVTLTVRVG